MDFALVNEALLVVVQELVEILDGDHVLFALAGDLVEHMAASVVDFPEPVGPVANFESTRFIAKPSDDSRQSQSVEVLYLPRNRTKNGGYCAALIEYVAAEARQVLKSEGKVQLEIFF